MYLTKLTFNWRHPDAKTLAGNPYALHKLLESAHDAPKSVNGSRLLWRVEREPSTSVLVQSPAKLEPQHLGSAFWEVQDKPYSPALQDGQRVVWRIALSSAKRSEGKAVGFVQADEVDAWAVNKLSRCGLHVAVEHAVQDTLRLQKPHKRAIKVPYWTLEGIGTVHDASKVLETVKGGLGKYKFVGLGLLSIVMEA